MSEKVSQKQMDIWMLGWLAEQTRPVWWAAEDDPDIPRYLNRGWIATATDRLNGRLGYVITKAGRDYVAMFGETG